MKKLSVVLLVSLLVSMVVYGTDYWRYGYSNSIIWPASGVVRVGIGTGLPGALLDVKNQLLVRDGNYVEVKPGGGKYGLIIRDQNSSNWGNLDANDGYLAIGYNNNNGPLYVTSGNVGIGTPSPQEKLNVIGNVLIGYDVVGHYHLLLQTNDLKFNNPTINGNSYISQMGAAKLVFTTNGGSDKPRMAIDSAGNVGIGTTSPQAKLHVYGEGPIQVGDNGGIYTILKNNDLTFHRDGNPSYICQMGTGRLIFTTNGGPDSMRMTIDNTGRVGIGTKNPQSKLAVKGKITAEELELTLAGWSDFVFADNYQLMSLDKLEEHIKVNRSLPGIPTEKEVKENGVEVGEMQAKLLEKVEELTLYVIDQNKELIELKKENEELRTKINALKN